MKLEEKFNLLASCPMDTTRYEQDPFLIGDSCHDWIELIDGDKILLKVKILAIDSRKFYGFGGMLKCCFDSVYNRSFWNSQNG